MKDSNLLSTYYVPGNPTSAASQILPSLWPASNIELTPLMRKQVAREGGGLVRSPLLVLSEVSD